MGKKVKTTIGVEGVVGLLGLNDSSGLRRDGGEQI